VRVLIVTRCKDTVAPEGDVWLGGFGGIARRRGGRGSWNRPLGVWCRRGLFRSSRINDRDAPQLSDDNRSVLADSGQESRLSGPEEVDAQEVQAGRTPF